MADFTPTAQQASIVDAVRTGRPVVVHAGAGTGKTSTLALVADLMADHGVRGIYITLNKDVARDVATTFTRGNITASTIHSLAHRIARMDARLAPLMDKLGSDAVVPRWQYAKVLGYTDMLEYTPMRAVHRRRAGLDAPDAHLSSNDLVRAGLAALSAWCASDAQNLDAGHVASVTGMPDDVHTQHYTPKVIEAALVAWKNDVLSPGGVLPFTHDHYLKLVSLLAPRFTDYLGLPPGSVIFFDEAQDSRPSITALLDAQTDLQLVAVGDASQAIYGFTGARDALPVFGAKPGALTRPLTTSWRFGAAIAAEANRVLDILDADIRLDGNPAAHSSLHTYDPEDVPPRADAILVRSNASLIVEAMDAAARGEKVAVMADTRFIRRVVDDVDAICDGRRASTSELRDFTSRADLEWFVTDALVGSSQVRTLVRISLTDGTEAIRAVMDAAVEPVVADVVLSTAHKSKGRQWPTVRLAMDPADAVPGHSPRGDAVFGSDGGLTVSARDSLMLLYVALTRAQRTVLVPDVTHGAIEALHELAARQ